MSVLPLVTRFACSMIVASILTLSACDHTSTEIAGVPTILEGSSNLSSLQPTQRVRDWNALSDSELWNYLVESDTVAAVGLRSPGTSKGYSKGRVLITPSDWAAAKAAVRALTGVHFIKADTIIPWVRVKPRDVASLQRLRSLPFIQYVEPAYITGINIWASGCSQEGWPHPLDYTSSGDILPEIYGMLRIDRAWAYANGTGIWIGLVDTGADTNVPELSWNFQSTGLPYRDIWRTNTDGTSNQQDPPCTHGTRLAGVIAAPMNSSSIVGVAWGAHLASVKSLNSVGAVNSTDAQQGIRDAGNRGAKVINMSWQSFNWMNNVEQEVEEWYYNRDVVFVGAAGTWRPCDLTSSNNVMFPAEMYEVLAVSPSGRDGSRPCTAGYGPQLDVITYQDQPTTAVGGGIASVGESSHASALVAGVATLVRQRFPSLTNRQVYDRIINTSGLSCGMPSAWHRLVNAEAAVGGLCPAGTIGPTSISFDNGEPAKDVSLQVSVTGGNGPIEYTWSNGATGTSTVFSVPNWGSAYDYYAYVSVRDGGSSNPRLTLTHVIHVAGPPPPCEPVPPQLQCNP